MQKMVDNSQQNILDKDNTRTKKKQYTKLKKRQKTKPRRNEIVKTPTVQSICHLPSQNSTSTENLCTSKKKEQKAHGVTFSQSTHTSRMCVC